MKIMVLGGAGDMGSRAVRDLARQPEVRTLIVGDYNEAGAKALAASLGGHVRALKVDANDHRSLVSAMELCDVVASAVGPFYKFEVKCARAAIEAGRHYLSLCDDYDAAQAVLGLHAQAVRRGVTVLTGMGWTPGLSNILARKAAGELDSVEEIHVHWGGSGSDSEGFAVILHTLHIFTGRVPTYRNGEQVSVKAGTGRERTRFPAPVGEIDVYHLGHPEPITLPRSFAGVRNVTLKGGLSEGFLVSLARTLGQLRLTDSPAKRQRIAALVKPLLPALAKIGRPARPCSAIRVEVRGTRGGRPARAVYAAADHMNNLTGLPLAIGAVMIGRGEITTRGVVAPEDCVPADVFLSELARRNVIVYRGESFVPLALEPKEHTDAAKPC